MRLYVKRSKNNTIKAVILMGRTIEEVAYITFLIYLVTCYTNPNVYNIPFESFFCYHHKQISRVNL